VKNNALVINGLCHSYEKKRNISWTLDSINLEIQEGHLLGLLGPSGCGKTTLLKLIAGFEKPNQGEIIMNNNLLSSSKKVISPENRNIGMVFQDYALFPHLNVIENVNFGLRNKRDTSRVDYLLNVLGIDSLRTKYPHQLSGGQKQRLAIARALAPGTSFLLLDEPFCSLDLNVRLRIRSELPNILRSCNTSGLMVTHDPEEAMAICDEVAIMNNGKIHQCDNPKSLMNNPKTLFVSSFIQGNNILKINYDNNIIYSVIGKFVPKNYQNNFSYDYISISPKSINLVRSDKGIGVVVSKEFLGEFYVYKINIEGEEIRVRSKLTNDLDIGQRCNVNLKKNNPYYLFPGGLKNII